MDLDNLGYGAGGGFLSAILIALGFKSRMDKQDKEIENLKNSVVTKDVFAQFEKRFDAVTEKMDRIGNKIDTLITHALRHRKEDGTE